MVPETGEAELPIWSERIAPSVVMSIDMTRIVSAIVTMKVPTPAALTSQATITATPATMAPESQRRTPGSTSSRCPSSASVAWMALTPRNFTSE